jgi:hypothetical protein
MDSDELLVEGALEIYENKTKAIVVAMEVSVISEYSPQTYIRINMLLCCLTLNSLDLSL